MGKSLMSENGEARSLDGSRLWSMAQAPVPLAGGFDVGADLAVRVEEGEAAEPEARVLADARRARPRRARCRPRRRSPPSRGARPSLLDVAQPARAPPNATETLEIALPDDVVDDDVREVAAEVVDAEPVFAETAWTT